MPGSTWIPWTASSGGRSTLPGPRRAAEKVKKGVINGSKRFNGSVRRHCCIRVAIGLIVALFAIANAIWLSSLSNVESKSSSAASKPTNLINGHSRIWPDQSLRKYPPHRYYKLMAPWPDQQPSFLTHETEYIHGKWPILLYPTRNNTGLRSHEDDPELRWKGPFKLWVDQTEWRMVHDPNGGMNSITKRLSDVALDESLSQHKQDEGQGVATTLGDPLPFADGTNPSIITLQRIQTRAPLVAKQITSCFPQTKYVATVCMTNSQCSWKDTADEIQKYHISTQTKPDTIRTVLILMDDNFRNQAQATIYLSRDGPWGRKLRDAAWDRADPTRPLQYLPALDDARLFLHNSQIYVSYREGPGFGYETQVLNPVHLVCDRDAASEFGLQAFIRASETSSFCCGRNMALMEGQRQSPNELQSLTWVDPITTMIVDTTPGAHSKPPPQPREGKGQSIGRRTKKSHIHGTNGFMVDLPHGEPRTFLGVAHFHRPNDREKNPYARFGHHYTHAFYTIQNQSLKGLSAEFVLPSVANPEDAEIIQFASGLEYDAERDQVVIAYGINDCEAAVTTVDWNVIESMLLPVTAGKEVVDYMLPLERHTA